MTRRSLSCSLPILLLLLVGLVGCGGSSKPITVSINAPASTNIDPGNAVTLTAAVDNDSADMGVTWTLTATGCTGSACGALSGNTSTAVTYTAPSTVTTAFSVTITATSAKSPSATNKVTLSIPVNPVITTALGALAAGQVGSTYGVTVVLSGGISPYAWTVKSGNLPAGLTLGASSGTISGTPTASGNYTFTLQVTDSGAPTALTASGQFTIDIAPAPVIQFITTSLVSSVLGDAYTGQLDAIGGAGTLTYAVTSGSLPAGLTMATTGAISGKSTTVGTSSFTVTASDAYGDSATDKLAITIDPVISVNVPTLPTGYAGSAYPASTLDATGGLGAPYTWTWVAASGSSLPPGLSLSNAGVVFGTPTTGGTYSVVVTAKDSGGNTGSATASIVIDATLAITTASLPTGYVGSVYPQTTLAAAGGAGSPYTWTWAAATGSSLPGGLNLSSAGVMTGTPTTAGTYSVVVTAKDSASHSATATLTITVDAALAITTASLPTGYAGSVYPSTTLAATGGVGSPYTWTWAAAAGSSLPAGLNLSGAGVVTGTPATAGSYSVVITAKDSAGNTANATFTISIGGAVSITTASLPNGIAGAAYTATQLTATGGAGAPYTWTWVAGSGSSLPAGLNLSKGGLITGTPATAGTYSVDVTAKDSAGNTASATVTIVIEPTLSITTATLPTGYVGTAYAQTTLVATGGTGSGYTWTWAAAAGSSLPGGLNLSTAGVITGTPTSAGSYSVVVTAKDSASHTATATLTITVNAAVSITTASLPAGYVGSAYTQTALAASGGAGSPYTWTWAAAAGSSLAAGLNFSAAGVVTGTPTTAGSYSVVITAKDSAGNTGSKTFTITVGGAVSIATTSLPSGNVNVPYTQTTLTATGGAGTPYTWSWLAGSGSSLPAGLHLSSAGVITGTPTAAGTFNVVVTAKDSAGNTAQAAFSIVIEAQLTVTTASLPPGYAGVLYPSTAVAASGGSGMGYTWTWAAQVGSSLPLGLNFSLAGVITGTPTTAGTYSIVFTVTDSAKNTANASLVLTVNPAVSVTTASLPVGYVGSTYTPTTLAATGGAGSPYTWTWAAAAGSSLPGGLTFSGAGVITGSPTTAGSYSVVVTAKDSVGNTGSKTFTITVSGAVSITTTSLPTGYQGTAYTSTQLTATGGAGAPYTWTWVAGSGSSLPAGLSLSTGGLITGTPTAAGTFSVVITAKDSANNTAQATFAILVEGALAITTPAALPAGELPHSYTQQLVARGGSGIGYSWSTNGAGTTALQGLGLALGANGLISTTGASPITGSATFAVTVTDSLSHTATTTFSLTIYAALVDNTGSFTGAVGSAFTGQAVGAGGETPYTWNWSGTIPPGLSLATSGAITGTPTTAGPYSPLVTLRDAAGFNIASNVGFTINGPVSVTAIALPNGYPGSAYPSTQLSATGGTGMGYTFTWAAAAGSTAPTGLSLSSSGLITGTPTTTGTYSVVVTAKDSASNAGSATFSIVVDAKLAFTPTTLPTGAVSEVYPSTTLLPTGGSGAGYSFTATGLPPGIVLSTAGVFSGTPTTQGTYSSVVVTLKDSAGNSSNRTLSITVNASLAITTTSPLAYGVTGTAYSQQLAATGGTGTLTWTATASNLGGFALSLSGTGLVSGTPNGPGTINFTANVKDSSGATASVPFTFTVYSTLQQNAGGFTFTGTTGVAYSGTINGTGGSGNYCWVVTGLSDGITAPANNAPCGYAGFSITISGVPTSAANIIPTFKLIDTTTSLSVSSPYTIVISNPTPLTLPAPNPGSLPSATVNEGYYGSISASGGVGPTFTWTVDGNGISMPGLSVSIGDGLSATTNDNNILSITGTPTSTTPANSPISFSAQVTDNYGHSATQDYSIAVNAVSTISGQIQLLDYNSCNGNGPTYPTFAVSINTSPVQVTSTDSNGNFSFSNLPNGTYTITPSLTGGESVFYPASYTGVVISNNSVTGENFGTSIGYTVSGNITYSGAFTGTTYIYLQPSGCGGGDGYPGASIPQATLTGGGAFTIRGVPPGDYTIGAWMDPLGQGQQNTEDPGGSAALVVSTSNVTGANVTMVNPTQSAPTQVPKLKAVAPTNLGAIISYGSGSVENSNGVEVFTSYVVQWSTTTTGFSSSNSVAFVADGSHANVWLVYNGMKGISGSFSNGTPYYFRVEGVNPVGPGPWTYYGGPNVVCNSTTCATTVTIGTPSGAGYNTITGTVTIPSSITPTGPLFVGFFDQDTNTAYATEIASPSNSTPNAYTVEVPNGTDYFNFAILDQNNDGQIGAVGDISNTNVNNDESITVSGPMSNQDITLPTAASTASVTTSYNQNVNPGGSNTNYGIGFNVRLGNGSKLPVNVTLMSGPNVLSPVDLSNYCQGCGTPQWQYYPQIDTAVPSVGDSYTFDVTYSDTTSETFTAAVTAVLGPGNLVTALAPNPNTASPSTTPTFTWIYPANPGNYTYQFYMQQNNGSTIWQIPGNNSNSNGFTYTQIPMPAGLVYGTDPTDNTNTPLYSSLTGGLQYNWSIRSQDSNGNSATVSTYFAPQ